jgi:hypothetical protein
LRYVPIALKERKYRMKGDNSIEIEMICFGKYLSHSDQLCKSYFTIHSSIQRLRLDLIRYYDSIHVDNEQKKSLSEDNAVPTSIISVSSKTTEILEFIDQCSKIESQLSRILSLSFPDIHACVREFDDPPCEYICYSTDKKIICNCGAIFCNKCKCSPYHDGYSCDEAFFHHRGNNTMDESSLDKISKDLKNYTVRICPNCKIIIEKNTGCNKMTCFRCKIKFCWLCMEKSIDYSHYNPLNNSKCANMLWK